MEVSRSNLSNCVKEIVRNPPEPSRHHLEASRPALTNYVKETARKLTPEPPRHDSEARRRLLPPDKVLENCTVIQISARVHEKGTFKVFGFGTGRERGRGVPVFFNC